MFHFFHDSNPSTSSRPLFERDQQWGFGTSDREITVNGPAEGTSTFYDFITLLYMSHFFIPQL